MQAEFVQKAQASAGIDFFRRAMEFQRTHAGKKRIDNTIQTNGTLITEEWCHEWSEENPATCIYVLCAFKGV